MSKVTENDIREMVQAKRKPIETVEGLSKYLIGRISGYIYFKGPFRVDFENTISRLASLEDRCKKQQDKIKAVKIRLEYYLMGNLSFNDETQKEFEKLLKMLEE